MIRFLTLALFIPFAGAVFADEHFTSYQAYEDYVDGKLKNRDFIPLIKRLGGSDEYTDQQLQNINRQFLSAAPYYLGNVDVAKRVELQNGYAQEMRVYWNERNNYLFFYAFLHDRPDGFVVLKFSLNTSSKPILAEF